MLLRCEPQECLCIYDAFDVLTFFSEHVRIHTIYPSSQVVVVVAVRTDNKRLNFLQKKKIINLNKSFV